MKCRTALGLAALWLAVCLAGCTRQVQGAGDGRPQAMAVKIEVAQLHPAAEFTEYIATLQSRRSAVLRPDVEGQVSRILVRSGDRVARGTPLLEIDPQKQQATLSSQEANRRSRLAALEYNRSELERRKQLHAAGVISRQELEQAQSAFDASQADVEALEATVHEQQVQLHYHVVKAPAEGVIGDIPVRVGDRVKSDTVLTTLDQGGELEAYISIPAELAPRVRPGMPVEIVEDGRPAVRVPLSFISPRVDMQNQLLLIKAIVPNAQQRFRNDQLVHAHVIWSEAQRPLIPVTAVSRLSGQTFAFVQEGEGAKAVARLRPIRTGDLIGNSYVVLDGIKPGDKIITTGVQLLVDGMPVAPES